MGKGEIVKSLVEFKDKLGGEFKVDKLIFFGSVAAGKAHKDSDIDLIIVSKEFKKLNFIKRAARMYDYWTLDWPVDFLCYTPKEFKELSNKITIVREAVRDGIMI